MDNNNDDIKNKNNKRSDIAIATVIIFVFFIVVTIGLLAQEKAKEEKDKKESYPVYNGDNSNNSKEKKEIVYYNLTCYKTKIQDDYELSMIVTSNYRDGEVQKVDLGFQYYKRNSDAKDGYVFSEIDEIDKLNLAGLTKKTENNRTRFTLDFENHPELKNNEILEEYSYMPTTELNWLTNERNFSCNSESTTKYE